jgi:hypothetical protein
VRFFAYFRSIYGFHQSFDSKSVSISFGHAADCLVEIVPRPECARLHLIILFPRQLHRRHKTDKSDHLSQRFLQQLAVPEFCMRPPIDFMICDRHLGWADYALCFWSSSVVLPSPDVRPICFCQVTFQHLPHRSRVNQALQSDAMLLSARQHDMSCPCFISKKCGVNRNG